jgi:hypothetical protein
LAPPQGRLHGPLPTEGGGMTARLAVISGGLDERPYVCTACGARFRVRGHAPEPTDAAWRPEDWGLEDHLDAKPDCRAALNRPLGYDPP